MVLMKHGPPKVFGLTRFWIARFGSARFECKKGTGPKSEGEVSKAWK